MRSITAIIFAVACGAIVVVFAPAGALADLLKAGDMAPQFSTEAVYGDQTTPINLSDYRGQIIALYFYPKDFTRGCTTEACTFRDSYAKIKQAGIVLLGCSVDTADSHRAFIKKYGLPFPLLLDPDKKIATEYDVANGIAKYGLDGRVTYVIGGDGRILKVYPKVDPGAQRVRNHQPVRQQIDRWGGLATTRRRHTLIGAIKSSRAEAVSHLFRTRP